MPEQDAEISKGTPRRDEMTAHGVRGLLLLNGGGAVALLAFLQQSWNALPSLVPYVTYGMIPLIMGATFAVAVHFLRIETALRWKTTGRTFWQPLHKICTLASFVCFVIGMGIVIGGAINNFPPDTMSCNSLP